MSSFTFIHYLNYVICYFFKHCLVVWISHSVGVKCGAGGWISRPDPQKNIDF